MQHGRIDVRDVPVRVLAIPKGSVELEGPSKDRILCTTSVKVGDKLQETTFVSHTQCDKRHVHAPLIARPQFLQNILLTGDFKTT